MIPRQAELCGGSRPYYGMCAERGCSGMLPHPDAHRCVVHQRRHSDDRARAEGSVERWGDRREWREGECQWCGGAAHFLEADHCHRCGVERGLAHRGCNSTVIAEADAAYPEVPVHLLRRQREYLSRCECEWSSA